MNRDVFRQDDPRQRRGVPALVALDGWVFTLVVGWVNAPRDATVWLGWAAAAVMVGTNVAVAQRVLRSRG